MKKLLTILLAGVFTTNAFACYLQFSVPEKSQRATLYKNYDTIFKNAQGEKMGTSFHHIIPHQDLVKKINKTFESQAVESTNAYGILLKSMANQFVMESSVPFIGKESTVAEIANVKMILENLASGYYMDDQTKVILDIDGKGSACDIKDLEGKSRLVEFVSYIPADGFIGPKDIWQDPGNRFDNYGYFFDSTRYRAIESFSKATESVALRENLALMLEGSVSNYEESRWMQNTIESGKVCIESIASDGSKTGQCVKRPTT